MATLLNPAGSGRATSSGLSEDATANQVVFIDSTVNDYASLLDGLAPDTSVYLLDPDEDGLQQIADVMQGLSGIQSVSIVAHGAEGEIRLGSTYVDSTTLSQSQAAISTIGAALAPNADILLYGCDTGEGADGQALVDQLAAGTGANVAAASHLIGDTSAGESWNLDVTSTGSALDAPQVLSTQAEDSYAGTLSAAPAPPAGFPLTITSFSSSTLSNFTTSGGTVTSGKSNGVSPITIVSTNTSTGGGALELTGAVGNETATVIYNKEFSSANSLQISFQYYFGGGTGADGMSFFLINGDEVDAAGGLSKVTPGNYGGALSYADEGTAGAGLTDGFLGIGFDTFGNFIGKDRGESSYYATGTTPNTIGVRGAEYPTSTSTGSGSTAYSYLTEAAYTPGIDGTRNVIINLIKVDSTHEQLSVYMSTNGGTSYTEVITNYVVNQALPSNFYLGFGASTGGSTDVHQINSLAVTLPITLAVSQPTFKTPSNYTGTGNYTLTPGEAFSYTYTITNSGPNSSSTIALLDNASSVETGVTWSVADDAQTQTGSGNINLSNINLNSGDSATITVSGTISSTATTGNASHTVTATPGSAYSYANASTGIVELAIGSPNPQLTGTTTTVSTSGTTAVAPFAAAQVADAHSSPTLTATITLAASGAASGTYTDANGKLSGTGLTETGTAGVYTLTAGSVSAFNADLDALVFTPTSASKVVSTTLGLSVSDGVSGTTPATATTVLTATCFLAGTRILAEEGEVAVETLFARHAAGLRDRVAVLEAGEIAFRPVAWVGGRHLDAGTVASTAQYPVRIAAGAFADAVPSRDLLVTPEHCVFVEGRLVPARMLVNGRSIVEDRSVGSYSYYHVELERHGVLISEGLTTESYLDTGNRGSFGNNGVVSLLPNLSAGTRDGWQLDCCAPLATAREEVEPIWRRLDRRADLLGLPARPEQAPAQHDPALCVRLDDGSVVPPRWLDGARHFFPVPRGRRAVGLRSRSAVPACSVGAFVDDRRRLGVQVERVVLWQGLDDHALDAASLDGSGWHAPEQGRRWTDGDAALTLPVARDAGCFLEVVVTGTLDYPADPDGLAAAEAWRFAA